jgi:hypothetical protein
MVKSFNFGAALSMIFLPTVCVLGKGRQYQRKIIFQNLWRIVASEPDRFRQASNYVKEGVMRRLFPGRFKKMKILQVIMIIAVFLALSQALSGIVVAQPPIDPASMGCNAKLPLLLAQTDYGGEFDLDYCQRECRMRYGLEPTGGGPGPFSDTENSKGAYELHQSSSTYNQYAACIADCNRQFWAEFDKKTQEPGKKR